ncbi:hypothetical protein [Sulfurimonas sp.]|jgi:hypothetical protein|uniref:hypothetical protein n=1 Tax=Sulfurimonas sp. TaxID=2022749 RepID=UPI002A371663|nr:hypothetical protein [Sulfurimonas sp.]MDY0123766.1 hypothetical protein [Sulfurimonas sp.]
MLFRDELKETMEVLKLTKELEDELKRVGARGASLSDKIKSFEVYSQEDFDEDYEYREYKRGLLGGRYNRLRWVAHERNQAMHQNKYLINQYLKFKYTIKDAIKYLNGKNITLESLVLDYFPVLPFLIISSYLLFNVFNNFASGKTNVILSGLLIIFGLALTFQLAALVTVVMQLLYSIYDFIQNFITTYKIGFVLFCLAFAFMGRDLSYLTILLDRAKCLF